MGRPAGPISSSRSNQPTQSSARPQTAAITSTSSTKRRTTSSSSFHATMHSPPRFVMDGAQLPFGKNAGLARQTGPIQSLSGKVFVPHSWTGQPKHKSKADLFQRRKMNDKVQQNELQSTLDGKLNIVKRPTLATTYGRVLAGCVPIPCFTRTQSELFQTRSKQYLTNITEKFKSQEDMRANHPSVERSKLAIQTQEREWEKNVPVKSRYEQLIAPVGRDRELARKSHWTKEHHPYIGPNYRKAPKYPTRQDILEARKTEINQLATQKIEESWNRTQNQALKNEKLAREASLNHHVPLNATRTELFQKRALLPKKDAERLKKKSEITAARDRREVTTAPVVQRGWWQKGDQLIDSSDVLSKGSVVRLRTIAQREVQPSLDPFKTYNCSMHELNRTRELKQKNSVENAVVDRTGPEWEQGTSHLPKQPSIPVKRWSDVVIEFQQADQKLDDERMEAGGGGGGGGGGGSVASLSETRPLYSSFTKDQVFREPVYDQTKRNAQLEQQPSFVLQPLGAYNLAGKGSKRSMTVMQRIRRQTRFQETYASKIRGMQASVSDVLSGSLQGSSGFVPMTPGGNDREKFRDCGSSRGNPSRQTLGIGATSGLKMDPPGGRSGGGGGRSGPPLSPMGGRNVSTPSGMGSALNGLGGSLDGSAMSMNEDGHGRHTQSVPHLEEDGGSNKSGSRASTAPSNAQRNKRGGSSSQSMRRGDSTPALRRSVSRGSARTVSRGSKGGSSMRPTTAPLRMTKRPGTAVRTRGFWDDSGETQM